jgi:hypothetical protein
METIKSLVKIGKLHPSSWEEATNTPTIYTLGEMESLEPEEFDPMDWTLDRDIVVNNFGNHAYSTIAEKEGDYYTLLFEEIPA